MKRAALASCALAAALVRCGGGSVVMTGAVRSGSPRIRYGPERDVVAYTERAPEAKRALLAKINAERSSVGAPSLAYDLLGAKVGDAFCLDSATEGTIGHWDARGRAPYLRWAEAGGVDYHAENFGSMSRTGRIGEPVGALLLDAHAQMMAEKPPDDGHRRTILDPIWTHVGIGVAVVEGELRMTEEYSRHVMEWIELPDGPLPVGSIGVFSSRLPKGWSLAAVEIAYETFPKPLTPRQIRRRGAYQYPPTVRTFRPILQPGFRYPGGGAGDFSVSSAGTFELNVPLASGPGNYYVMVFAGRGNISGKSLSSCTAARIVAGSP